MGRIQESFTAIAASAALLVSGCGKETSDEVLINDSVPASDLNTGFNEIKPAQSNVLINQTYSYQPGQTFEIMCGSDRLEVSRNSSSPVSRLLAASLDYMCEYHGFTIELGFVSAEACTSEFPSQGFKIVINPSDKKAFSKSGAYEVSLTGADLTGLTNETLRAFTRQVYGMANDDIDMHNPVDLGLNYRKLLAEMEIACKGDAAALQNIALRQKGFYEIARKTADRFDEVLNQESPTIASQFDDYRVFITRGVREFVIANEIEQILKGKGDQIDFKFLDEVFVRYSNPLNARSPRQGESQSSESSNVISATR